MGSEDVTPTGKVKLPLPAPTENLEPTKILAQLKSLVDGNKKPAAEGGGGKSWVSTLIIIAVTLAAMAVWAWISWRQGRELAKLRHAKEVERIRGDNKVIDDAVAKDRAEIDDLNKKYLDTEKALDAINARIKAAEAQHEADKRAISAIRSWRDAVPPSS